MLKPGNQRRELVNDIKRLILNQLFLCDSLQLIPHVFET